MRCHCFLWLPGKQSLAAAQSGRPASLTGPKAGLLAAFVGIGARSLRRMQSGAIDQGDTLDPPIVGSSIIHPSGDQ